MKPLLHSAQEPPQPDIGTATVPLVEESLEIEKIEVDKGGFRITRQVEAHDQLVDELLRDQRIEIERRPMAVRLQDGELPETRYEGDVLVMPIVEEVLVTEKRWMLVEEVRIKRIDSTHRHQQTVTLRRQDVAIERLEAETPSADEPSSPSDLAARHNVAPRGY